MNSGDWTAIGTVALAAATVALIVVTIVITVQDRRRAAAALTEEREMAETRLREERDHAEEVRRRERHADTARVLLQRIAALQPFLASIPGMSTGYNAASQDEERRAVESLRHGALAEVPLLGTGDAALEAADRYRYFARLVDTVAGDNGSDREWLTGTLRNYARWVRISLGWLAADGVVPGLDGGSPVYPLLGNDQDPLWAPSPLPPGWDDEADTEI